VEEQSVLEKLHENQREKQQFIHFPKVELLNSLIDTEVTVVHEKMDITFQSTGRLSFVDEFECWTVKGDMFSVRFGTENIVNVNLETRMLILESKS